MQPRLRAPDLRMRMSLWLLLPLLGLLALDAWLTYQRAMQAAHAAFDRTLEFSLRSIREGVHLREGRVHVDLPYLALEMFESSNDSKIYYLIREEEGQDGRPVTGYADLPQPAGHRLDPFATRFYDTIYRGVPLRMALLRLPIHDVPAAQTRMVQIMVGETIEPRQALAQQILTGSLLQEGLLVVLALGIVWLGVGRGLRPLNRLSAKVATRSEDDSAPLAAAGLPREVMPLVEAINQYIARSRRMQESRRRFFADAAHQLKTPLAVIQAETELAQRGNLDASTGLHLRRLNRAVRQAVRAVQQLLSLSRLDAGCDHATKRAPVLLHKIARSVTLDWSPVARSRGIDLGFEQQDAVELVGHGDLLKELIGNLIDNAIRYSGDGAVITVRVARRHTCAVLEVTDNGPGIARHEREVVFERFYRCESTQNVEGNGLGLAIVAEIARVHEARVTLDEASGGGLAVTVAFPAGAAVAPATSLMAAPAPVDICCSAKKSGLANIAANGQ